MVEKNLSSFIFSNGRLVILNYLKNKRSPAQFKELRDIKNPNTDKKYSSATVSKTLKELEEENLIDTQVIKSSGRKTLGYIITEKGEGAIKVLRETADKLEKL